MTPTPVPPILLAEAKLRKDHIEHSLYIYAADQRNQARNAAKLRRHQVQGCRPGPPLALQRRSRQ